VSADILPEAVTPLADGYAPTDIGNASRLVKAAQGTIAIAVSSLSPYMTGAIQ